MSKLLCQLIALASNRERFQQEAKKPLKSAIQVSLSLGFEMHIATASPVRLRNLRATSMCNMQAVK